MNRRDPRPAARHRRYACKKGWRTTHNPWRWRWSNIRVFINGVEIDQQVIDLSHVGVSFPANFDLSEFVGFTPGVTVTVQP